MIQYRHLRDTILMTFNTINHNLLNIGIITAYRLKPSSHHCEFRRSMRYCDQVEAGHTAYRTSYEDAGHHVEDIETLVDRPDRLVDEEVATKRQNLFLRSQEISLIKEMSFLNSLERNLTRANDENIITRNRKNEYLKFRIIHNK